MPWAPKTHRQTIKQRRGGLDRTSRPKTAARGYGGRWQRLRSMVLARDPICMICRREPSSHVDHKLPKSQGGTDRMDNLQGLCARCHNRKTATEDGGFGNG